MLDALLPFVDDLETRSTRASRWRTRGAAAADVATERRHGDTADLRPKVGRARPLAERSVGTPDAGAISLAHVRAHRRPTCCHA